MSMTRIVFPAQYLIDAAPFVGQEMTRHHINGVAIQQRKGKILLVATDGRRLVVFQPEQQATVAVADGADCIVRLEASFARLLLPFCRANAPARMGHLKWDRPFAVIDPSGKGRLSIVVVNDGEKDPCGNIAQGIGKHPVLVQFEDVLIDGTFPDWRRVVPTEFKTEIVGNFQPRYLAAFAKLSGERDAEAANMVVDVYAAPVREGADPAGSHPHLVRVANRPDVFGILMSVRRASSKAELPDWMADHMAAEVAAE